MVPNGIIARLTREFGGNVHDQPVVDVTSGSFEKETQRASNIAMNAADLESARFSFQPITATKKISGTCGTVGCVRPTGLSLIVARKMTC
jgi:hypothetical protein